MEKLLCFVKNFYLQVMEDEYTLIRSPVMDKTKWIEKLKYDVLRFSLDSVDLNLIEVGTAVNIQVRANLSLPQLPSHVPQAAPIRLCMCNMHTSACDESLTVKVGTIQLRQLVRLYPGSWLEAGSVHIPELRINAKFDCHPPTAITVYEQLEFLRRHDQQTQRLHFLYNTKSQQTTGTTGLKRPSTFGLPANTNPMSCACLGGSPHYYTLVQGEQFFKSSFRLSEQPSFGLSLFQPDVHVLQSHPIFKHKYDWHAYERAFVPDVPLPDEESLYPFDFCALATQEHSRLLEMHSPHSVPGSLYAVSRPNSVKNLRHKSFAEPSAHKRSSSSIARANNEAVPSTSSGTLNDGFVTPGEHFSSNESSRRSLHNVVKSSSIISLTPVPDRASTHSSPASSSPNLMATLQNEDDSVSLGSSGSSSTDSLSALEELLRQQQVREVFSASEDTNVLSF